MMKRVIPLIAFFIILLTLLSYLQFGRPMKLHTVITTHTSEGYVCQITVVANKLIILDKEQLTKQINQNFSNNDFRNMAISEDVLEHLKELKITIYTNEVMRMLDIPL